MSMTRYSTMIFLIGVAALQGGVAFAQDYPNKPVRIFAGSVGSGNDLISRLVAPGVSNALGQPFIIENRGGGSAVSGALVAKAPSDGYTLIAVANSFWTAPLLQSVPYDVARDFSPITTASNSPLILAVHPSLPVKSVKELIALAKSRPGELNYSSSGSGGTTHIAAELLKTMANVNIVRINYSSSAATLNSVVSGEVSLTFDSTNVLMGAVKSGRIKALAVTTAQPSALVPGVPTVASSGLPGFEAVQMNGILAPAKTPQPIITRLNQEIVRALNSPEVKAKLFATGVEVVASSPEALGNAIRAETERVGKVIKQANIKLD